MKRLSQIGILCLLTYGGVTAAFANSLNLNLFTGAAFSKMSSTQSVTPIPGSTDNFVANQGLQNGPLLGAGLEYDIKQWTAPVTLGLGLSAYYIDLGILSGVNTQTINGTTLGVLNYYMLAQSSVLMFEPRLIYSRWQRFQPYVLGGVGYAWNTLSDFAEVPITLTLPDPPYTDHTTGHMAYEGGVGLQYALTSNQDNSLSLRAEYRYMYLGNAELGPRDYFQTTSERFVARNIDVNVFDIGLTYRF